MSSYDIAKQVSNDRNPDMVESVVVLNPDGVQVDFSSLGLDVSAPFPVVLDPQGQTVKILNPDDSPVDFNNLDIAVQVDVGDSIRIVNPDGSPVDFDNLDISVQVDVGDEIRILNSDGSPINFDTLFDGIDITGQTVDIEGQSVHILNPNDTVVDFTTLFESLVLDLSSIDISGQTVKVLNPDDSPVDFTLLEVKVENVDGTTLEVTLDEPIDVNVLNPIDANLLAGPTIFQISKGEEAGTGYKHIFGSNERSPVNTEADVWEGPDDMYPYPSTPDITHVSQELDQPVLRGALIEFEGLDANWDPITQTVALDATDTETPVPLGTPLIRLFMMRVLADSMNTSPIVAHNSTAAITYGYMTTNRNKTLMAQYTVPNGQTGYITDYYANFVVAIGKEPKGVIFLLFLADRASGYTFQIEHAGGAQKGGDGLKHQFTPYLPIPQKTDIKLTANPDDQGAHTHAGFNLILVEN